MTRASLAVAYLQEGLASANVSVLETSRSRTKVVLKAG
jgi:hypothetical protein